MIVRLCSIECCFRHPFDQCALPADRDFVADLRGWAKVCDRLWMWDYTTDFAHYLLPFPNLDALVPNVRLLAQNHVTGIFEEGDYSSPHGEFQQLREWLGEKVHHWGQAFEPPELLERSVGGPLDAEPYLAYLRGKLEALDAQEVARR